MDSSRYRANAEATIRDIEVLSLIARGLSAASKDDGTSQSRTAMAFLPGTHDLHHLQASFFNDVVHVSLKFAVPLDHRIERIRCESAPIEFCEILVCRRACRSFEGTLPREAAAEIAK
jgi:hypothetical protein